MASGIFGYTEDGEAVHKLTITNGSLEATIITWGAAIQDLRLRRHDAPLVIGYRNFKDYATYSPHFGAIAGHFSNRIRNARFEIDGQIYHVDPNLNGKHNLNRGSQGLGRRNWKITSTGRDFVTLATIAADGD